MYIVPNKQITFDNELQHHGILGMKWGIRRFQPYPDGEKKGKEVGEAARLRSEAKRDYKTELAKEKNAIDVQRNKLGNRMRDINTTKAHGARKMALKREYSNLMSEYDKLTNTKNRVAKERAYATLSKKYNTTTIDQIKRDEKLRKNLTAGLASALAIGVFAYNTVKNVKALKAANDAYKQMDDIVKMWSDAADQYL